eukprot:1065068_1
MSWSGYKQSFENQQLKHEYEKQLQIHSVPSLPDDVDEYGNLPNLRCGWKACGKTFHSKEELLNHVKLYMDRAYVDRFHINCKNVLEMHPDLTLSEFEKALKDCYPETKQKLISHEDVKAYYDQFQPYFKSHEFQKNVSHQPAVNKEIAEILFGFRIQSMKTLMRQNRIPQQFIA